MTFGVTGGDRLLSRVARAVERAPDGHEVRVGFLEGATYPDGTPVAAVAAWQEFGTRTVPSRPFFRTMIRERSPGWSRTAADLLRANDGDVVRVLELMGLGISAQLQQSIVDTLDPPLSAVTLMLRRMRADDPDLVVTGRVVAEAVARVADGEVATGVSTKPLVDTGHLLASVSHEVT